MENSIHTEELERIQPLRVSCKKAMVTGGWEPSVAISKNMYHAESQLYIKVSLCSLRLARQGLGLVSLCLPPFCPHCPCTGLTWAPWSSRPGSSRVYSRAPGVTVSGT